MTRRISLNEFQTSGWLPDTEIVGKDGKIIAYMPPPIKPLDGDQFNPDDERLQDLDTSWLE